MNNIILILVMVYRSVKYKNGGYRMNNKTQKLISATLLASMLVAGTGIISESYAAATNNYQMQPLQGKVVVIPAGVPILATTTMELSSDTLALGQNVCVGLSNNFYYNNTLVAPLGSSINGTVIQVKKAGRAGVNGQLMVKFTNIVTPYGQMIPISGKIQTDDGTGIIKGGTKMDSTKEYAKDIGIGAAAGAVMGTIMGPLSGGKVGKGAVYGTAVGATAGLAKSVWDKGVPATIPTGTAINIVVDQPITFNPQQGYRY